SYSWSDRACSASFSSAVPALLLLRRPVSGSIHWSMRHERSLNRCTQTVTLLSGIIVPRYNAHGESAKAAGGDRGQTPCRPSCVSGEQHLVRFGPGFDQRHAGQFLDADLQSHRQAAQGVGTWLADTLLQCPNAVQAEPGPLGKLSLSEAEHVTKSFQTTA